MTDRKRIDRVLVVGEIALTLVTMAVAVGFLRLFTSGAFLGDLTVVVIAAHLSAAVMRRRGWAVWWSVPLQLGLGVLVASWVYLGDTLWFGLPTATTWAEASDALAIAFEPFKKLIAPVPLTLGFELTMAIVVWVLAAFGDAAAFRGRAPFQAIVPHAGVVFATSIFARGTGSIGAASLFAAAVVFHISCQRALTASERRWVQDERERGPIWSMWIGAAVAATVGLLATVAGPQIPGAESSALVDLRAIGRGPGPVEVGNPLVGVSNLLGPQSDQVVFTVSSPAPHYWRLTSLEEFDGADDQWKTNRSYQEADSNELLEQTRPPGVSFEEETAEFRLADLGGVWLPTAFEPVAVDADIEVRHDPDSSSLIAGGRRSLPDADYRVTAQIPDVDAESFFDDAGTRTAQIDSVYLDLPDVGPSVPNLSEQIVASADARTMYEQAQALQGYFRGFTYRDDVDYSDEPEPIEAFLSAREGFCQQFASVFALMARSLGIPSRVAVGFTYGDLEPVPADEDGSATTIEGPDSDGPGSDGSASDEAEMQYVVRGRNAHAWPEVFIPGTGWLAFEPTPSRGNPDAAPYTGVAMDQQEGGAGETTATTTTTALGAPGTTLPTSGELRTDEDLPRGASAADSDTTSAADRVPAVAGILIALAVAGVIARCTVALVRRRRRRGRRDTPAHRVRAAWVETCDWLEMLSVRPSVAETPTEFAVRAEKRCRVTGLAELAQLETMRIYSSAEVDPADADTAEQVAASLRTVVADRVDRRRRVLNAIGWASRN
ncbi:MAG TPA: DUF3488 and transglutaminase-like domain-containing protein [Microthrixaceae bacterium]|nr:DUF3488 and transglutaminase-like domain-containing protein [Microthrixaceae bacterium]